MQHSVPNPFFLLAGAGPNIWEKKVDWSSRQAPIQSGQVTVTLFEFVLYKIELTISVIFPLSGLENLELIREIKN